MQFLITDLVACVFFSGISDTIFRHIPHFKSWSMISYATGENHTKCACCSEKLAKTGGVCPHGQVFDPDKWVYAKNSVTRFVHLAITSASTTGSQCHMTEVLARDLMANVAMSFCDWLNSFQNLQQIIQSNGNKLAFKSLWLEDVLTAFACVLPGPFPALWGPLQDLYHSANHHQVTSLTWNALIQLACLQCEPLATCGMTWTPQQWRQLHDSFKAWRHRSPMGGCEPYCCTSFWLWGSGRDAWNWYPTKSCKLYLEQFVSFTWFCHVIIDEVVGN